MRNSVYGKTMDKLRKRVDVKVVNIKKDIKTKLHSTKTI